MHRLALLSAAALVGFYSHAAHADTISTLFNTGVGASGAVLTSNLSADTNYTLVYGPYGGAPTPSVNVLTDGWPLGSPWISNTNVSAWIGPVGDNQLDGPVGNYDYRTTFSLAGYDPTTASITGAWAVDNQGIDILINGVSTGQISGGFGSTTPFSINSGFVSGLNTLDFIVYNGGGPTGLLVTMTGNAAEVPEPATLALLGMGFAGLGAIRRRKAARA